MITRLWKLRSAIKSIISSVLIADMTSTGMTLMKINGMRPTRSGKNDDGVMVDFIFGPAFICDCRSENLDSLSDKQIDRYGKMFRYPEHLARVNGTLLGIPYRPQPEQER